MNPALLALLEQYASDVEVRSIDEMVCNLASSPRLQATERRGLKTENGMIEIAKEIKNRIKQEIGEWLIVSIGIAPNRYLSKIASNLHKPDGLDLITSENIEKILAGMELEDLSGIKEGYGRVLRSFGITTPLMLYHASAATLTSAFRSKIGYDWWLWLHGYEAGHVYKEKNTLQKSFGQSCALTRQTIPTDVATIQVVYQLVVKMATRLRADRFITHGIRAGAHFIDGTFWQKHIKTITPLYATEDMFAFIYKLFQHAPNKPIHTVFVGVYNLETNLYAQLTCDEVERKKIVRTQAIDSIYARFGESAITSAITLRAQQKITDRIAFGKSSL